MTNHAFRNTTAETPGPEHPELKMLGIGQLPWDVDPVFSEVIRGKSAAVVGPARTILGSHRGDWIDSHGVVVRFNDAFEYFLDNRSLSTDIGSRTDILYCNQVILRKNILERRIDRNRFAGFARGSSLKYVVCTNNSLNYDADGNPGTECEQNDRDIPRRFTRFLADEIPDTKFRIVGSASSLLIKCLNGNWGRTGFIALVDLLGFRPSQVNVAGMTMYHGGGHLSTNGPELHPTGNRDGGSSISPLGVGHDSFLELEVLRKLLEMYGSQIVLDETLQSLLDSQRPSGS